MPRPIPLYRQIKQHLLERISLGDWAAGSMIPAEEQLARDFGVSRMTAHKAIRDLVQQGHLTRQAGVGTFVTGGKAESSLIEVRNIAEEVLARGHDYTNEVLKVEVVTATEDIAARLELRVGDEVFHTLILHRESGVPIQLEDRYVNPAAVPDYLSHDFSRHTPNEVLVAAAAITDVEHLVEAVLVSSATAKLLAIKPTEPCLSLYRRTWSAPFIVSFAHLIHPGSRYALRSTLHPSAR